MKPSETFRRCSEPVAASVRAGASIEDAARHAGCSPRTAERWLNEGRLAAGGPFGHFAAQVDAARREQGLPGSSERECMDAAELYRAATAAARNGSVPAMRLVHDMLRDQPDDDDGPDRLDELQAKRRRYRAAQGWDD